MKNVLFIALLLYPALSYGMLYKEIAAENSKSLVKEDAEHTLREAKSAQEGGVLHLHRMQLDPQPSQKRKLAFELLAKKRSINSTILDMQSCKDLQLLCGLGSNSNFYYTACIDRTSTELGRAFFYSMLVTPIKDNVLLSKRQKIISELLKSNYLAALHKDFQELAEYEAALFSFYSPDPFLEYFVNGQKVVGFQPKNKQLENFAKWCNNNEYIVELSEIPSLCKLVIYEGVKKGKNISKKVCRKIEIPLKGLFTHIKNKLQLNKACDIVENVLHDTFGFVKEGLKYVESGVQLVGHILPDFVKNPFVSAYFQAKSVLSSDAAQEFKGMFECRIALQEKLILVKKYLKCVQALEKKINDQCQFLKDILPSVKNLAFSTIQLSDSDKSSFVRDIKGILPRDWDSIAHPEKFENLLKKLNTPTFEGTPKMLSFAGRVLTAYRLVHEHKDRLLDIMVALAELEAYISAALFFDECKGKSLAICYSDYLSPSFCQSSTFKLCDFWNPLVCTEPVTNSLTWGIEGHNNRGIIITGANAGGKSTLMRAIIFNLILAQTFGLATAKEFIFSPFSYLRAYLNITDDPSSDNSLHQAASKRVGELVKIAKEVQKPQFSFLMFDEIFTGTNPQEGEALLRGTVEHLSELPSNVSIITTHYLKALKHIQEKTGDFFGYYKMAHKNDVENKYKLQEGVSLESCGIEVAKGKGLPQAIIDKARLYYDQQKDTEHELPHMKNIPIQKIKREENGSWLDKYKQFIFYDINQSQRSVVLKGLTKSISPFLLLDDYEFLDTLSSWQKFRFNQVLVSYLLSIFKKFIAHQPEFAKEFFAGIKRVYSSDISDIIDSYVRKVLGISDFADIYRHTSINKPNYIWDICLNPKNKNYYLVLGDELCNLCTQQIRFQSEIYREPYNMPYTLNFGKSKDLDLDTLESKRYQNFGMAYALIEHFGTFADEDREDAINTIKICLQKKDVLWYVNDLGQTCLHKAALLKEPYNYRVTRLLLKSLIKLDRGTYSFVNMQDIHGKTALDYVRLHNPGNKKLKYCSKAEQHYKGTDSNQDTSTTLIKAAEEGHKKLVEILLDYGANWFLANIYPQDSDGNTTLMWATEEGHKDVVEMLLNKGAAVNAQNKYGNTALMWAAYNGNKELVKLLLGKGSNINAQDKFGRTALYYAMKKSQKETVKMLLDSGADINTKDEKGCTLLIWATNNDLKEIVVFLLDKDADVNAQDKDGWTALLWAALKGYKDVVKMLLDKGAVVNTHSREGNPALIKAAEEGHKEVVKMLLDKRAAVNAQDKDGWTALLRAALKGHKDVAEMLLDKGAAVNAQDKNGWTALLWAAYNGHKDVVEMFLDKGADINAQNKYGATVLIKAAEEGHKEVVKTLLDKGAHINAQDKNGWTAVLHAAQHGHKDVVEMLLDKGAHINAQDKNGNNILIVAAKNGHTKIIEKMLLDRDTDVNATDEEGNTALMWAARNGHKEIVHMLLDKEADINAQDMYSYTAPIWAVKNGHEDIVKILLGEGVGITTKNITLMWAAKNGYKELVKTLLDKGTNVNIQDNNNGTTVLMWAAYKGHKEIVQMLLDRGADITAKDKNGNTALTWAIDRNQEEIVALLLDKGADSNTKDGSGYTALEWAEKKDFSKIVFLIKKGAHIHAKNNSDNISLIEAACNGHKALVISLLGQGADVNAQDNKGNTALIVAAKNGHKELVQTLLDKDANVNVKDNFDTTALMWAAYKGHKEIVQMLLAKGADINAQDKRGDTALTWAIDRNQTEIIAFLLEKSANVDAQDSNGKTALIWAISRRYKDIVALLLDKGADINAQDKNGMTALEWAEKEGVSEIVFLIEKCAHIHAKDDNHN